MRAADALEAEGISARVIDMHTVKPLDREAIATGGGRDRRDRGGGGAPGGRRARRAGGAGGRRDAAVPMEFVGIQETYAESGQPEELLEKYGLVAKDVAAAARKVVARKHALVGARHAGHPARRSVSRTERGVSLGGGPRGGLPAHFRRSLAAAPAAVGRVARTQPGRVPRSATEPPSGRTALSARSTANCCVYASGTAGPSGTSRCSRFVSAARSCMPASWRARSRLGTRRSRSCGTRCSAPSRRWSSSANRCRASSTTASART